MAELTIKQFRDEIAIRNKGIEIQISGKVKNAKGKSVTKQLGDLIIKKSGLIWCEGKTTEQNGKNISWQDFIKYMNDL